MVDQKQTFSGADIVNLLSPSFASRHFPPIKFLHGVCR